MVHSLVLLIAHIKSVLPKSMVSWTSYRSWAWTRRHQQQLKQLRRSRQVNHWRERARKVIEMVKPSSFVLSLPWSEYSWVKILISWRAFFRRDGDEHPQSLRLWALRSCCNLQGKGEMCLWKFHFTCPSLNP